MFYSPSTEITGIDSFSNGSDQYAMNYTFTKDYAAVTMMGYRPALVNGVTLNYDGDGTKGNFVAQGTWTSAVGNYEAYVYNVKAGEKVWLSSPAGGIFFYAFYSE